MLRQLLAFTALAALLALWIWASTTSSSSQRAQSEDPKPPSVAPRSEPSAPPPPPATVEEGLARLPVEVRDTEGRPIADCRVWLHDLMPSMDRPTNSTEVLEAIARKERCEAPRITDENGRVSLPAPKTALEVLASTDALSGSAPVMVPLDFPLDGWSGTLPLHVVTVAPRGGWRVAAVDRDSRDPVEGCVLRSRVTEQWIAERSNAVHEAPWDPIRVRTDATGVAVVPVVNELQPIQHEETRVGVDGVYAEPLLAPPDLSAPHGFHARFERPPTAALDVRVVDRADRPVLDVELFVATEERLAREPMLRPLFAFGEVFEPPGTAAAIAPDGRARFEQVEIGVPVVIVATPSNGARQVRERVVLEGDRALRIEVAYEQVELTARVLHADGRPRSNALVAWSLITDPARGGGRPQSSAPMDATGRVRIVLPDALLPDSAASAHLVLMAGREQQGLVVDVRESLTAGVHDLGALRLEPLVPLAAGRVVDAAGAPVAEARVELVPRGQAASTRWVSWTDPAGHFDSQSAARLAVTDRNGWFVIVGPAWDGGEWIVDVHRERFERSFSVAVALGSPDVEVVRPRRIAEPRGRPPLPRIGCVGVALKR